jgi:hypothetical protein
MQSLFSLLFGMSGQLYFPHSSQGFDSSLMQYHPNSRMTVWLSKSLPFNTHLTLPAYLSASGSRVARKSVQSYPSNQYVPFTNDFDWAGVSQKAIMQTSLSLVVTIYAFIFFPPALRVPMCCMDARLGF